ncbi:hypothetical protein F5148DRAFT_1257551 [Russula earlei]|uniref:Uncharacterized protein n=1 Tax=Russula earlei TaxID=71964 RepID=A0ACC0TU91_9AGAM|nr:hypothetical protein F5148DRAFT_1257551 [Russula earlei]
MHPMGPNFSADCTSRSWRWQTQKPSTKSNMRTWHIVHDISAHIRHSVLSTTFYSPSHDLPRPIASSDASTSFEFSKDSAPSIVRRLYLTNNPPTQASYRVHNPHIGLLSPLSRRPGSGFLRGSSTYNAILARSTSLISSLTSNLANPFFTSLKERSRLTSPVAAALSTDALLYSPSVVGLRRDDADHFELMDDDFVGELDAIPADPTTKELEVPPAVNAQNQRAMGEFVAPYFMNVLSAAPILVDALRSASYTSSEIELDCLLRRTLKARVARVLRLFASRGDSTLVLGTFGYEEGAPIAMVAEIYAELLACSINPGDVTDGEFRNVFQRVIFTVPTKLLSVFRKTFEMRIYEDELIRSLEGS